MNQKKFLQAVFTKTNLNKQVFRQFGTSTLGNFFNFSSAQPLGTDLGNLYTWGQFSSGTGFNFSNEDVQVGQPKRLDIFQNNVYKVAMGPYHSAVITGNGDLYTFGCGKNGKLGSERSHNFEPQVVEFFKSKGLRVVDVSCGGEHTIAITENGQVWSWGYGGNDGIMSFLYKNVGALGHGNLQSKATPQLIENLPQNQKVKNISSGFQSVTLLNDKNEVFNWGKGSNGCFGDGQSEDYLLPNLNENFQIINEKAHLQTLKIKTCGNSTIALLSDGKLYGMGDNFHGQLGVRVNLGHTNDQDNDVPTPVAICRLGKQKIVDFDLGQNSLVFLTDQNQVWYSGMDFIKKPIQLEIQGNPKIKLISAGKDSVTAVTENDVVYQNKSNISSVKFNHHQQICFNRDKLFDGGKILSIGGGYETHYAIVKN